MQYYSIPKNLYLFIQLGLAFSLLTGQTQVGEDIDGETANDRSGWSVSMDSDGSHVAIGSRYNDAGIPGSNLGHVRVYEYSSGSWSQVGADIDGEANTDYSGHSVSLDSDGSHVIIGAPENDGAGGYNSGHARVYEYSSGSWSQLGSDIDGDAVGDNMGISVSIDSDGSHIAVGAIYKDGNGSDAGHVRIFEYDGSAWSQVGSDIHGETAGDQSGVSVSIDSDGSHVAIGSTQNDDGGGNSGHVRVFEYSGSSWSQIGSDIDGEAAGDYSGGSISIDSDGSHVAIGAENKNSNTGQVRVFEYTGGSWSQLGSDIDGVAAGDYFGTSVSIDSDGINLIVGGKGNDDGSGNAGHVRLYSYSGSSWVQIGDDIYGESASDYSGSSVSIDSDGSHVALSAPYNSGSASSAGHVRVFTFEIPGITVSISDSITSEVGDTASFSVVLDSEPTADVTIPISSSDLTEGTVSPDTLTFTAANWNAAQMVTITGVNDDVDDGDIAYTIVLSAATSSDGNYNGVDADDVSMTNTDDDSAGITVAVTDSTTTETGETGTFTVVLNSEPTGDVVLPISSSDLTEGTVSPDTLTFTAANWNAVQTVTITGVNDDVDDGDIAYTILLSAATSSDGNYNGVDADDVSMTNTDDDSAGITVAVTDSTTTETGETGTFTVVLNSEPTGDVVLPISSSDLTEGTVSPDTLTFTAANWNAAQTVTITGVNDFVDDGDIIYTITFGSATSSDINYNGSNPSDESITNTDDDSAGITVVVSDSITSEVGETASFTVVLGSEPTADVTIGVSSSDETEGTVDVSTLTFTSGNWSSAQTVTMTGADDNEADGDVSYSIILAAASSTDGNYQGLDPDDISVTNLDYEPIISVLSTTIDFDSVVVLSDSTQTITVGNAGNENLVIDSVAMTSGIFSIESFLYPLTIAPAEDSIFSIIFYPQDTISYSEELVIYSNDPDSSSFQISLSGTGYNSPPIIVEIDEPDSVSLGDSVTVNITVTDDDSITTVVLNYFVGGDTSMYAVLATDSDGDGTFSAEIDSSAIGLTGVAYYVAVSDEFGNTSISDTVSIITQFNENVLNTEINGSAYTEGIPTSKWRLISVPTNLDNSSVANTIQDELSQSSSDDTWRLYEDSGNATWIEAESFVLGQGYWIQQRVESDIDFSTGSGQSVDLLGFSINIPSGWSLIGNPYPFELEITFDEAQVYGPLTYGSTSTESWDAESNILSPWQGYAIYNRTADEVALDIKPLERGGGALLKEADVNAGWQIVISIDNGEYGDIYNAIGRKTGASEQLDIWDNPEPPALDQYVSLNMTRKEWGVKSMLTTDIRSMDIINGIWDMNLDIGNVQGPFTVSTDQIGSLPEGHVAVLLDHIEHQIYDISKNQEIVITKAMEEFSYPISMIVGVPAFVEAAAKNILSTIPEKFALHQNFPNPFNPSTHISFSLPKPSNVEVKIYNILGQSVVTLINDWRNLGHHSVQWNGRDKWGESVGTGIYFYSLETADFRQVKKLMLLK